MNKEKRNKLITTVILAVVLILYLMPIFLLIINTFKPYREMFDSFIAFPKSFYTDNYKKAWEALNFMTTFKNSVIITATSVIGIIITASMAAYKLSRTKTKLSWILYMLVTVPYIIPFFSIMIPIVKMAKNLGFTNNLLGVSLIFMGTTGSFALIMLHGFVKTIPVELDEAAYIDGCSELTTFFRVILPLLKPAISSVAVIYILWTWNNFLIPFLLLTDSMSQTLIIRVYDMFGMFSSDWDIILASIVLISAPVVIMYAILQRKIISGITAGAVKG